MARRPGSLTTSMAWGQLLFDLVVVGHDQDLAEPAAEPFERLEHAGLALLVERSEDLVEHQQTDGAAGLEPDVFTDGHPQRQVGQVDLGAGEPVQAEHPAAVADLQLEGLGVDPQLVGSRGR